MWKQKHTFPIFILDYLQENSVHNVKMQKNGFISLHVNQNNWLRQNVCNTKKTLYICWYSRWEFPSTERNLYLCLRKLNWMLAIFPLNVQFQKLEEIIKKLMYVDLDRMLWMYIHSHIVFPKKPGQETYKFILCLQWIFNFFNNSKVVNQKFSFNNGSIHTKKDKVKM